MTLNEEIELLRSGDWFDKLRDVIPSDEYLDLGWAIGDVLETLELLRYLRPVEKTNADKFRAKSDEELAQLLTSWDFCSDECSQQYTDSPFKDKCPGNCEEQALKWLQRPAEEET